MACLYILFDVNSQTIIVIDYLLIFLIYNINFVKLDIENHSI